MPQLLSSKGYWIHKVLEQKLFSPPPPPTSSSPFFLLASSSVLIILDEWTKDFGKPTSVSWSGGGIYYFCGKTFHLAKWAKTQVEPFLYGYQLQCTFFKISFRENPSEWKSHKRKMSLLQERSSAQGCTPNVKVLQTFHKISFSTWIKSQTGLKPWNRLATQFQAFADFSKVWTGRRRRQRLISDIHAY